ncbi:unnamed protein product [Effrenium voratum]|nr:unnamed protein product [Effrenium voratum]
MLRPELVAIALAFCVSGRPDCSPGTCQTLRPYFKCEFDGRGTAGGGNTIATAKCNPATDIVVRTSFQLPSHVDNGSQPLFFNRMEAFTILKNLPFYSGEERFVFQALAYGFANDHRYLRRWIAKEEILQEHTWREHSFWKTRLVFEVASPAAECQFCMHMSLPLYQLSQDGPDHQKLEHKADEFIVQVSVMQRVVAVELSALPLQDLLQFLIGYVQDLTALAHARIWHDCHIGNVLMQQPEGQDVTFYWHDFAGSSFGNSKPRAEVLQEFIRKMSETIKFTAGRLHAHDPTLSIPSLSVDIFSPGITAEILQRHLREFNLDVQRHVLGWSGDLRLRQAVLRSLGKVLSPGRYEELQLELMKGSAAPQPPPAVWVCQMGSPDGEEFIGNAFQVKGVLANVDDLKEAIEKKEKLTIAASKINIHHQEDGRWVKDDEDSAVDRGKSKADCYGFTLPAGAAGAT